MNERGAHLVPGVTTVLRVCRRARPLQLFAMMLALLSSATVSAPASDLVKSLPGFNGSFPFKVYSGYLHVPGPFEKTDYDSLSIHYQFHTSQNDPAKDPLVTWHQGGPGGSSINVGLYTEMGYFQLDDKGGHANPYAWNKVANMLVRAAGLRTWTSWSGRAARGPGCGRGVS